MRRAKKPSRVRGVGLALSLAVSGCVALGPPPPPSLLGPDGSYAPADSACRVRTDPGDHLGSLLGAGWTLVNYASDTSGRPLRPRTGPRWDEDVAIDLNDDGRIDVTATVPRYDLLYESRSTDARIWLRLIPVSDATGGKSLPTLAERYARSIAGGVFSWNAHERVVVERRWAARIVSAASTTVAGRPAYAFDVDVANLDQLRLTDDARDRRLRVVIVRSGDRTSRVGDAWVPSELQVLTTLVLSSSPRSFDRDVAALGRLASHIAFEEPTRRR